jgi:hypothetical protein
VGGNGEAARAAMVKLRGRKPRCGKMTAGRRYRRRRQRAIRVRAVRWSGGVRRGERRMEKE